MTPFAFRDRPSAEQIEMLAHHREHNLRQAHAAQVADIVAKDFQERENNSRPPRRR